MLVEGVPAKHPRRTLTLVGSYFRDINSVWLTDTEQIAKMLQNLANKPSYAKEQYMMTLNPFVENNKARINQFLNNLCEVGDFYDTLEVSYCYPRRLFSLIYLVFRWINTWHCPRKI